MAKCKCYINIIVQAQPNTPLNWQVVMQKDWHIISNYQR